MNGSFVSTLLLLWTSNIYNNQLRYTIHMVDIEIYGSFVFEPEVYNGYIDYSVLYISLQNKVAK